MFGRIPDAHDSPWAGGMPAFEVITVFCSFRGVNLEFLGHFRAVALNFVRELHSPSGY